MHLPRQPDSADVAGLELRLLDHRLRRSARRLPPVDRILLAPTLCGRGDGMLRCRGGENLAALIADERLGPAGADVDAEKIGHIAASIRLIACNEAPQ